jgi:hypothetical protein
MEIASKKSDIVFKERVLQSHIRRTIEQIRIMKSWLRLQRLSEMAKMGMRGRLRAAGAA